MWSEVTKSVLETLTSLSKSLEIATGVETGPIFWINLATVLLGLCAALFSTYYWGRRVLREKLHQILVDPEAFWSKRPTTEALTTYRRRMATSRPVIAIANYKGGVGKSMIAANLAAYFDIVGYRVLLLDFDYQGSLTDIVPYADPDKLTFSAHEILLGHRQPDRVSKPHPLYRSFRRTAIHPAEAALSRIDSNLVYQWLTEARKDDIRFNTQAYLSSPTVQNNYDIVIIDTPPRICAATANALAAATHVLIPTVLDTVSSRAALRSTQMFLDFREKLGLSFKMLGLVPSRVNSKTNYDNRERMALSYLKSELHSHFGRQVNPATGALEPVVVLSHLPIMKKTALLHLDGAALEIFNPRPAPHNAVIREMFFRLGSHVLQQLGLTKQMPTEVIADANLRTAPTVVDFEDYARAGSG